MNFSMLAIRLESRAPCQKKCQKTTSNEGSPKAKAKPCLVPREQRSEEISSRSLVSLVNLGTADERKEVVQASRQLVLPDERKFRKQPGNGVGGSKPN